MNERVQGSVEQWSERYLPCDRGWLLPRAYLALLQQLERGPPDRLGETVAVKRDLRGLVEMRTRRERYGRVREGALRMTR